MITIANLRTWIGLSPEVITDDALQECIDLAALYANSYMASKSVASYGPGYDSAVEDLSFANVLKNLDIRGIKPASISTAGITMASSPTAYTDLVERADRSLYHQAIANNPRKSDLYFKQLRSGKIYPRM